MPLSPVGVLPPTSLEHALSPIAELSEDQFDHFKSAISTPEGFDLSKARCRKLAPLIGLHWQTLAYSLGAVNYLYNRFKISPASEFEEQVSAFVSAINEDTIPSAKRQKLLERLKILVRQNTVIDESKKLAALRIGFLPNLRNIRTFVDLRPNFTEKYSSVKGFIPVIQFRIATDSDDPRIKQIVFQLDERRLQTLKKALLDVESKLNTLASSDLISGLEIRTESDEDDE